MFGVPQASARLVPAIAAMLFTTTCVSAATPKILIVSIDGCRPDALQLANTPNVDALIADGAASFDGRNILDYGSSGPNYSSMLTGVNYPKHGVTTNNSGSNGFLGNHFDQWPHMFARIKASHPELYLAQFCGWGPINAGTWADRYADKVGARGDTGNRDDIIALLRTGNPDVIFWQISMVDSAGHSGAFSPANSSYLAAIEQADRDYGKVLAALYNRPGYIDGSERWLILTVTDHGGYNKEHASPVAGHELEMQRTFYIATGPMVRVGADLGSPRVYDVAVTAMHYLGMDTSGMNLDGQVVLPLRRFLGDFDHDLDVDLDDFALLRDCISGPLVPYDPGCQPQDLDTDNDVDQSDFGLFQRCYSGSVELADTACEI